MNKAPSPTLAALFQRTSENKLKSNMNCGHTALNPKVQQAHRFHSRSWPACSTTHTCLGDCTALTPASVVSSAAMLPQQESQPAWHMLPPTRTHSRGRPPHLELSPQACWRVDFRSLCCWTAPLASTLEGRTRKQCTEEEQGLVGRSSKSQMPVCALCLTSLALCSYFCLATLVPPLCIIS